MSTKTSPVVRKTIYLPQTQIDYIRSLAEANNMGVMEFYRWLVDNALLAYEAGTRPKIINKQIRNEAEVMHWSSQ